MPAQGVEDGGARRNGGGGPGPKEPPGRPSGRDEEGQLKGRRPVDGGRLHRCDQVPAADQVAEAGHQPQPPAEGRGRRLVPAAGRILIGDGVDPPLPLPEHLGRLVQPLDAVVAVAGDDERRGPRGPGEGAAPAPRPTRRRTPRAVSGSPRQRRGRPGPGPGRPATLGRGAGTAGSWVGLAPDRGPLIERRGFGARQVKSRGRSGPRRPLTSRNPVPSIAQNAGRAPQGTPHGHGACPCGGTVLGSGGRAPGLLPLSRAAGGARAHALRPAGAGTDRGPGREPLRRPEDVGRPLPGVRGGLDRHRRRHRRLRRGRAARHLRGDEDRRLPPLPESRELRLRGRTEKAGVGGEKGVWNEGATFVDINNDGRLDLYVCRFNAPNLLL